MMSWHDTFGSLELMVGDDALEQFRRYCVDLLYDAQTRSTTAGSGRGAWVERTNRLLHAAATFLTACGLLRYDGTDRQGVEIYTITTLGRSAYERLRRSSNT